MVDLVTIAALALLVVGVVGCVLPGLPGPPLSLAGVYLYWWHSGFSEPGTLLLVALTAVGLLAIAADLASDVVSARIGGASLSTSMIAGAVGIVLLPFGSPVTSLVGVVVTVFALEYRHQGDARGGAKAASVVVLGMVGSKVVRVLLTTSMLVAFGAGVVL